VFDEVTVYQPEADFELTLGDLARCCELSTERVVVLVSEGVLEPAGRHEQEWRFSAADLARARCAQRLEHDLGINAAGVALVLELLDESRALRAQVRLLESVLGDT
jgi:chaperone modulatory protein CbpM